MKLYTAFVCAALTVALSAHAGPAPKEVVIVNTEPIAVTDGDGSGGGSSGNGGVVFVDFSETLHAGDAGIAALYGACPVGTRMCTTSEIVNSVTLTAPTSAFGAWVRASPMAAATSASRVSFLDASGIVFEGDTADCAGWTSGSGFATAIVVDSSFRFSVDACNITHAVACCGPAP